MIYLDSSALVKLVVEEPESTALRAFLSARSDQARVTSALARIEVVRAVTPCGEDAVERARTLMERIDRIQMTVDLLDEAGGLGAHVLRTTDAIHIASALRLGRELRALVSYDRPLLHAATASGLITVSPA